MKVSDYVVAFLAKEELTEIFTVSGGGIAHLLDSIGQESRLHYHCNYHEQASAIAAEGYARVTGKVGVCLVTIGPGAINALSGIVGAWYDSIPLLVISGQVRSDLIADYTKVRQRGPQEGNVIEMAQPVTKYAFSVREPARIRCELEKALHLAKSGRPGPVWIEIPFDVQGAEVDASTLAGFEPEPEQHSEASLAADVAKVAEAIKASRCPLVIVGNGVRLAGARKLLLEFIERNQIPAVTHCMAKDLLAEDHPQNMGVFGTAGQRRANFAIQNADLLIVLGASLCVTKLGFNYAGFAPRAKKVVVNIDPGQVKHQALQPDIPVVADVKDFLEALLREKAGAAHQPAARWTEACAIWRQRYPIILDDYFTDKEFVNIYVFMDRLSGMLKPEMPCLAGNGFDVVASYQAFKVKEGQRLIYSGNWGSMGWDLPLAIGVCFGIGCKPTVLATGDGSFQWNIQELLTAQFNKLPLKIFILNNGGYGSIRLTQNSLFGGRLVAADASSGVGTVDFRKLADLYGFHYVQMRNNDAITACVEEMLQTDGPAICEVMVSPDAAITPKASAFRRADGTIESRPLEDMAPFLPREEIAENMSLVADEHVPART